MAEIRSFLGFVGYYRRFVPQFAEVAFPLTALTKKDARIPEGRLDETQRGAFIALKQSLINYVMLNYVVPGRKCVLDCDASAHAIGACLSQVHNDGNKYLISCVSKTLGSSRQKYCNTRKELYCVVYMLRYHRGYIRMVNPSDLTVRTDHGALKWLLSFSFQNDLYQRWIGELEGYGNYRSPTGRAAY